MEDKWIQKYNEMAYFVVYLDTAVISSLVWKILCDREQIFFCLGQRPDVSFINRPIRAAASITV